MEPRSVFPGHASCPGDGSHTFRSKPIRVYTGRTPNPAWPEPNRSNSEFRIPGSWITSEMAPKACEYWLKLPQPKLSCQRRQEFNYIGTNPLLRVAAAVESGLSAGRWGPEGYAEWWRSSTPTEINVPKLCFSSAEGWPGARARPTARLGESPFGNSSAITPPGFKSVREASGRLRSIPPTAAPSWPSAIPNSGHDAPRAPQY